MHVDFVIGIFPFLFGVLAQGMDELWKASSDIFL